MADVTLMRSSVQISMARVPFDSTIRQRENTLTETVDHACAKFEAQGVPFRITNIDHNWTTEQQFWLQLSVIVTAEAYHNSADKENNS